MRIDLPGCNIKNCRFCFDGNCLCKKEWERCEHTILRKTLREAVHDIERLLEKIEQTL